MRPGTSRVLLTIAVLCIASNGCVRWGEEEEQDDDQGGCGIGSADSEYDGYTSDPTTPTEDDEDDNVSGTRASGGDPTLPDLPQWPTPWPIDADAAVVVWGKTGIPTKNLRLVRNIYLSLGTRGGPDTGSSSSGSATDGTTTDTDGTTGASDTDASGTTGGIGTGGATDGPTSGATDGPTTDGATTDGATTDGPTSGGDTGGDTDGVEPVPGGGLNILWVADCDPRTDAVGCLAGNVQPYFAMVDTIGNIDFKPLSEVDPLAYDVVVADFCGPVSATTVGEMLGEGARVLVLGDRWCVRNGQTSAAAANELLEHIGTRFDGAELYDHDFLVSEGRRVGILEGVERIDAWGVALQGLGPEFDELLGTSSGTLLSSRN